MEPTTDPTHESGRHTAPGSPGALLDDLRERAPLVQCITNSVVTNVTANMLLALGAAPVMIDIVGEAGVFANVADAVLANLGTPDPEQRDAIGEAVVAASESGVPWVLDPVGIGALPVRTPLAHELLESRPAAVRGNASEILALAGGEGGRGVDSTVTPDTALDAAREIAATTGAIVAISGQEDLITDGTSVVRVRGGHELLTKVIGTGCSLGAYVAAFLGGRSGDTSALDAVVAAHSVLAVAGRDAAQEANGPGSFAVALLDRIAGLSGAELDAAVEIECH